MKLYLLAFLFFVGNLYGLEPGAIRNMAAEEHNRENLVEELKVFPNAREYEITIRNANPGEDFGEETNFVATEKTIRGRFIVSEIKFPGVEKSMIMVVTYDKRTDTFKKWVLFPNDVVGKSRGVADVKKRTISWLTSPVPGGPPTTVLSIESHWDDKTTWKETTLGDGKVIQLSRGVAVKTQ